MSFKRLGIDDPQRFDSDYIGRCTQHQESLVQHLEERVQKISERQRLRRLSLEVDVLDDLRSQLDEERLCLFWLQVSTDDVLSCARRN
jgi:hypothetical protein